ncbi:CHAT domain-containing protein [Suillus lakei]|nr:CHAT domain-containing protein [Suillus lakei]
MKDKPLTLLDIMENDAPQAELAFLSACHTAVGDEETPDEVVHLAAGPQFSGFKSVIGTLWVVDDAVAKHNVEAFYERMLKDLCRLSGKLVSFTQWAVPAPSETEMDWEPTVLQSNNDPLLTLVLDVAAVPSSSMRPSQPSSGTSRRWTSDHADRTLLLDERDQGPPKHDGETTTSFSKCYSVRRRRGWACVDADADEVISDDEDEVECNRRSQLHLMYALADATVSSTSPRSEEDYFLLYISTSIMHPRDDDPAGAIRVRLNSHQEFKEDPFPIVSLHVLTHNMLTLC